MATLDPKKLPNARKAPLPAFIQPQLATLVKDPPSGEQWIHELKFDGYRMLCRLERRKVQFWSRNGKEWTLKFSGLATAMTALSARTAILDGEIIVVDAKGRTSFQSLQRSMGREATADYIFAAFDLIYLDGYDLTRVPLIDRKKLLKSLCKPLLRKGRVRYSDHIAGNGKAFFKQACKLGIEGIISKLANSPYETTRTRNWLKIKCNKEQEFVIAGYTPTETTMPGFGALILGYYDKGKLVYAGRVGTGFTHKQRVELKNKLDRLARKTTAFAVKPKDPGLRAAVWSKPKLVGQVVYTEWTSEGNLRHPSFQGLREDKKPSEVVREVPK